MEPASVFGLVLTLVLVLVVGGLIAWPIRVMVRKQRTRRAITAFGWHLEPPTWARIAQFSQPPFDYGFTRTVSQAIVGTSTDGTPFQAFRYGHQMPRYATRLAMVALPRPLPAAFVSTDAGGHTRIDLRVSRVEFGPRWDPVLDVGAADVDYARALFTRELLDALAGWATTGGDGTRLDLSIDGANLVAVGAPSTDDPEALRAFVDRLAGIAKLIDAERLASYAITPKAPNLGFRGTNWTWAPADPNLIQTFAGIGPVARGERPQAIEVVTGTHRNLGFTAFHYRWEVTTTSSNGQTTTTHTTVHLVPLLALHLPAPVPVLTIAHGSQQYARKVGPVQPTPYPAFDAAFDMWTSHPQFAADVMTEQMASWLLQWRPPVLMLTGSTLIAFPTAHSPQQLWSSLEFLCAFCDLIPAEVWFRVGAQPPKLSERTAEPEGLVGAEPEGIVGQDLR